MMTLVPLMTSVHPGAAAQDRRIGDIAQLRAEEQLCGVLQKDRGTNGADEGHQAGCLAQRAVSEFLQEVTAGLLTRPCPQQMR